jgi:hypothetical protein
MAVSEERKQYGGDMDMIRVVSTTAKAKAQKREDVYNALDDDIIGYLLLQQSTQPSLPTRRRKGYQASWSSFRLLLGFRVVVVQ